MQYRTLIASLLLGSMAVATPAWAQQPAGNSQPAVAANLGLSTETRPGVMALEVDASDVERAIFTVRQTIPVTEAGEIVLRMPEWLPGKHAPRGAVASIANLTFTGNGRTLTWVREPDNVYAFRVTVPAGVREIEARFQSLSPTRTAEGRIVMTPAMLNLQWEQVSLYPAGYATRAIRVRPSVILPQNWTGAAALDGEQVVRNRINYGVTDYETLVDSPMFAGEHFRRWDLGHNVRLNVVADEARFLEATPDHINAHRALVDEAVTLFGSRHFDRYEFLLALTEQLGGIGLEHHRSSENSQGTDYFTNWANTASSRGLLPHELTHSWNGKFRRPAGLATPDYNEVMDGRLLWVYEGQTSYWDLVLGARSGLQSRDMILGEWARNAAFYQAQSGRAWRSVEDTTLDPIIAARRPRPYPTATRTEDYYNESSLIWMEADMIIRGRSNGQKSLDDFARTFFGTRDGDWGTLTYTFDDVVGALNAVQPYDWNDFLTTRFRGVNQPAPLRGLEMGGYRLVFREVPSTYETERMANGKSLDLTFSLGATIDRSGNVTSVRYGSPMFDAGVTNGTRIVSVGGAAYDETRMKAAISAAKDGRTPITLMVERNGRFRTITPVWTGGLRYPHLERTGNGPALLDRVLDSRRAQPTAG